MELKLAKLTPRLKKPFLAFADFEIPEFGIKIKGCCVRKTKTGYIVRLPMLEQNIKKDTPYSPITFLSEETAHTFFQAAKDCIQKTYPQEKWKDGLFSKFNQGLAKTTA